MPGLARPFVAPIVVAWGAALVLAAVLTVLRVGRSGLGSGVRPGRWWPGGVALVGALMLWVSTASPALALNLVVDSEGDSLDPAVQACTPAPNDCSLRGALKLANAVAGPHTITLPAGTYKQSITGLGEDAGLRGDWDILQDITINGAGPDLTVVTGDESLPIASRDRIFEVHPAGSLTVRDLSIRRGGTGIASNAIGGGVLATGPLTMERVSVRLNEQFAGGGVFIRNNGTIRDSLIFSNVGATGAGVAIGAGSSSSSVLIENTTISGNTTGNEAGTYGGGLLFSSDQAGRTVTLNNVTIADNSAVDGGGVYKFGLATLFIRNTIVANNTATGMGGHPNCKGTIVSQGHNLVFNGGSDTCGFDLAFGDIVNIGNPKLSPLQGNGGPTATYALGSGSAAVDAGDLASPGSGGTACAANDQRGLPRNFDGDGDGIVQCDIGAVEGGVWYAVDTITDSYDPAYRVCDTVPNNSNCSLRGAIGNANAAEAAAPGTSAVITLPARGPDNPYRLTVPGAGEDQNATGDLDILADITIVGGGASATIIDGNFTDRVFHVRNTVVDSQLKLQDLTVQNGNAGTDGGGGIFAQARMALLRVRVRANTARTGAGIFFLSATGRIFDSTISSNIATAGGVGGGGIGQGTDSAVTIINSTIALNQSASGGGGLVQLSGTTQAVLKNVTIAGNSAGGGGGVLQAGTYFIDNTIVSGNTASIAGTSNCGGSGAPMSLGYNLEFGGSTCSFTQGTDQHGDPRLGPLQLNDGPTETMALGAGSAAIDAGSTATPGSGGLACLAADQRGSPRPVDGDLLNGARCDIGAYELQTPYPADLVVSISDAPDPVVVGHPVTYTATVTNNSLATAVGVSLTDTLPTGVSFGSATPSQGSCAGASTVICTLGNLAAATSATVTIVVTPSQGGSLSNTASASAQLPDPTPANNAATATTFVQTNCQPRPNVRVTTAVAGAGQLSATIAAQTSAATPANSLSSVRITSIGNATVQVNGTPVAVNQTVTLSGGTQQASLLLQRQTAGQASMVAFAVTDGCGEWRTFVGGGPSAF